MEDWQTWSKHVIKELKRLDHNGREMVKAVQDMRIEITKIQTKSNIWYTIFAGAAAGSIPVVAVFVAYFLTK